MFTCLLTDATGFVGRHLAEDLIAKGCQVTALVPSASDDSFLRSLGIRIVIGDSRDPSLLRGLVADTEIVIHDTLCSHPGMPTDGFETRVRENTQRWLEASKGQALSRFVHVSSLEVYADGHHFGTDETSPLPAHNRNRVAQAMRDAEKMGVQFYLDFGVPVVILRSGYVYGPGDCPLLNFLIADLRDKSFRYYGSGTEMLSLIYIGNLAHGVFLAFDIQEAVGEIYNLTDGEPLAKRQLAEAVAHTLDLPFPMRTSAYWPARVRVWLSEFFSGQNHTKSRTALTRRRLRFLGHHLDFCIDKAREQLGYRSRFSFDDGIYQALKSYKEQ